MADPAAPVLGVANQGVAQQVPTGRGRAGAQPIRPGGPANSNHARIPDKRTGADIGAAMSGRPVLRRAARVRVPVAVTGGRIPDRPSGVPTSGVPHRAGAVRTDRAVGDRDPVMNARDPGPGHPALAANRKGAGRIRVRTAGPAPANPAGSAAPMPRTGVVMVRTGAVVDTGIAQMRVAVVRRVPTGRPDAGIGPGAAASGVPADAQRGIARMPAAASSRAPIARAGARIEV